MSQARCSLFDSESSSNLACSKDGCRVFFQLVGAVEIADVQRHPLSRIDGSDFRTERHTAAVAHPPACLPYRTSRRLPSGVSALRAAAPGARGPGARRPTAPARHRVDERPCVVGSLLHAFVQRRIRGEVLDQSIGIVERSVSDQCRAQRQRVVVARTSTNANASLAPPNAKRNSSMVIRCSFSGSPAMFVSPLAPLSSRSSNAAAAPSGEDRVLTTPAAAKAPICARKSDYAELLPERKG